MGELPAWSRSLTVEVGGHGVVSHTGSAALRMLADRTGLTGALSSALRRRGFTPVHDRGRVLADTAVLIADGGRVMSDLAVLRDRTSCSGRSRRTRRCGGRWRRSARTSANVSRRRGRRSAGTCGS